jgi:hypothetical protein
MLSYSEENSDNPKQLRDRIRELEARRWFESICDGLIAIGVIVGALLQIFASDSRDYSSVRTNTNVILSVLLVPVAVWNFLDTLVHDTRHVWAMRRRLTYSLASDVSMGAAEEGKVMAGDTPMWSADTALAKLQPDIEDDAQLMIAVTTVLHGMDEPSVRMYDQVKRQRDANKGRLHDGTDLRNSKDRAKKQALERLNVLQDRARDITKDTAVFFFTAFVFFDMWSNKSFDSAAICMLAVASLAFLVVIFNLFDYIDSRMKLMKTIEEQEAAYVPARRSIASVTRRGSGSHMAIPVASRPVAVGVR